MDGAGLQRQRSGTVIPTDVFVFAFLAVGVSGASNATIGHEAAVVVFTVAWMSTAITRTAQFRRGERPALQLSCQDFRRTAILLLGSMPWVMLGFLQSACPLRFSGSRLRFPVAARAWDRPGLAVIVAPLLNRLRWRGISAAQYFALGAPGDEYRFPAGVMIRSGAIMLLSGSPVFGLLCALWLGAALWRPTTHRHNPPEWAVASSMGQPLQSRLRRSLCSSALPEGRRRTHVEVPALRGVTASSALQGHGPIAADHLVVVPAEHTRQGVGEGVALRIESDGSPSNNNPYARHYQIYRVLHENY
jgi:hypothetical protein